MSSTLFHSVAKTKLLSNILRRDAKKINFLSLRQHYHFQACPTVCNKKQSFERSLRFFSTTGNTAEASSSSSGMSPSSDVSDYSLKSDNDKSIVCHTQYHDLMNFYIERGDTKSIEKMMVDMNHHGLAPTIVTINKLLAAYTKDTYGLQSLLENMRLSGIEGNISSIGALMNSYAVQENEHKIQKVLHDSIEGGYTPGTCAIVYLLEKSLKSLPSVVTSVFL